MCSLGFSDLDFQPSIQVEVAVLDARRGFLASRVDESLSRSQISLEEKSWVFPGHVGVGGLSQWFVKWWFSLGATRLMGRHNNHYQKMPLEVCVKAAFGAPHVLGDSRLANMFFLPSRKRMFHTNSISLTSPPNPSGS